MSDTNRAISSIPAPALDLETDSGTPDAQQLVSIALFSGIGLLVSLVAVISGMTIGWF